MSWWIGSLRAFERGVARYSLGPVSNIVPIVLICFSKRPEKDISISCSTQGNDECGFPARLTHQIWICPSSICKLEATSRQFVAQSLKYLQIDGSSNGGMVSLLRSRSQHTTSMIQAYQDKRTSAQVCLRIDSPGVSSAKQRDRAASKPCLRASPVSLCSSWLEVLIFSIKVRTSKVDDGMIDTAQWVKRIAIQHSICVREKRSPSRKLKACRE